MGSTPGAPALLEGPSGASVLWVVGDELALQVQPGPQELGSPDGPMLCDPTLQMWL